MNRTMAIELSNQMEAAEKLYAEAVAATGFIERGNVQLKRTADVKRSSGWFMFLILVCAGVALLVIDFWYPG
jgi:hypothetical protein